MGLLSHILGNRKLLTVHIHFTKSGEYAVQTTGDSQTPTIIDLGEVLSHYYVKTLFMVGKGPVGDFIIASFGSISRDLTSKSAIPVSLIEIADRLGSLLNLGFNVRSHLNISEFNLRPNIFGSDLITHRIDLYAYKNGDRFINTHPSAWQGKIYIPLALFAYYNYLAATNQLSNHETRITLAGSLLAINQEQQLRSYYQASSLVGLSKLVNAYYRG
jgi:hypothetical protein